MVVLQFMFGRYLLRRPEVFTAAMFTTFDRYLLGRLIHTFVVLFVSAYGLYIVIDLFTNADDFQGNASTMVNLIVQIGLYYYYRAFEFFELAGPVLIVLVCCGRTRRHFQSWQRGFQPFDC